MRLIFGSFAAQVWAWSFLRNLRRQASGVVADVWSLDLDVRGQAQRLFDEQVATVADKQGRLLLAQSAMLLAAYRQLKTRLHERSGAFDTVRRAFAETMAAPMTLWFRAWLWRRRDPVGDLQRRPMADAGRRMYGQGMEFSDETTPDTAELLITRCAYSEFFTRQGEPGLTLIVCAWDRAWMDVVQRSGRPVRVERPSTISTGGDCCRFRFVRDAAKSSHPPVDVVLVQLETSRGGH